MKLKVTILALSALIAAAGASAQAPRIRTSAPSEKTAVLKGSAPAEQAPAAAPAKEKKGAKAAAKKSSAITSRFMAVKTNLAYDAVAVLNAAFELQVSRHFSVELPVMWSLWDWKTDLGLRVVAVQPEVRYWFGKVGSGSALGANVGVASYNFRHDDIRYQNISGRPLVSVALSYTYALRIDSHWSAEFELALGYANAKYNRYYNIDNGAKINQKTRNYFGPTKIGISLCYRFGK